MKSKIVVAGLCAVALLFGATGAFAQIMGLYYQEVEKDGRVYVFNTPERAKMFQEGGELGTAVTLIGKAEGGKTLVGENETAIDLYLFKHNLPAYERPTPKPVKAPDYPKTTVKGRIFTDFTWKDNEDKGTNTKSADSGVGLDVKRFYFGATHDFNEYWSVKFTSDIGDVGAKRYDVFVKHAYLQYKSSPAFAIRFGSSDVPWIPFVEGIYGMRYFEQTITDTLAFGTSADWGIHALGDLVDGKISYAVSAVNGKGYSSPQRSEGVDFEGRIAFKPGHFVFAVGGYTGKLGNDKKSASPVKHTAQRINLLAAYTGDHFAAGAEYFTADNWKNVTTVPEDSADGISLWGSFGFAEGWKIFGRFDTTNPSKDLNDKLQGDFYTLGAEKKFTKSIAAAFAYKHVEVKNGTISGYQNTVGSTVPGKKGSLQEAGVWFLYDF